MKTVVPTRFLHVTDFDRVIEIDCNNGNTTDPTDLYNDWNNGNGMLAVDEFDYPLGFCIYRLDNPDHIEIQHLVVDTPYMRVGVGTSLIDRMTKKLSEDRRYLVCDLPETNLAGQLFLRKMEFRAELIKNYDIDILRFKKDIYAIRGD
jgi:ribosomal protein S18 acetylase RimI-like enzyme